MWRRLVPRLTITLLGVLVIYAVLLTVPNLAWRIFVAEEAFREMLLAAMRAGERQRCEAAPGAWSYHRPGGGTYYAYDPDGNASHPEAPALPERLAARLSSEDTVAMDLGLTEPGPEGRFAAARMPWDGPCAILQGRLPVTQQDVATTALVGTLFWAVVCALLTLAAALLVYAPMVRRVRRLQDGAEAIARGRYAERLPVDARGELGEIARAFNRAAEEVEKRDRAMTQLLQNVSHDLVTPLASLQAAVERLEKSLEHPTAEAEEQISCALEEVTYLTSLVEDLKAASRAEAGLGEPRRGELDLREVVERIHGRYAPLARRRNIALEFSVPDDPVLAAADPTQLQQALANVVQNAIQYHEAGGHVAIVLEGPTDGHGFRLVVRDDGPGVPADQWPRLTERLFRGDEARARRPGGMGLGLAITAQIVEAHGWSLEFGPVEPQGLEVRIEGR